MRLAAPFADLSSAVDERIGADCVDRASTGMWVSRRSCRDATSSLWGQAYLDTDPDSRDREPPAVKTPAGAFQDIFDAWAGHLACDPAQVEAPVAIIRGEWDSLCTDADAAWLFNALHRSPGRRDVKIARAT